MKSFLKNRLVQIVIVAISIITFLDWTHGFAGMSRKAHVRYVDREIGVAVDELNNSEPGVKRMQTFIDRLKKIDTNGVPEDVTKALQDYIAACQNSLEAFKFGLLLTQADISLKQARQRLLDAINKYE